MIQTRHFKKRAKKRFKYKFSRKEQAFIAASIKKNRCTLISQEDTKGVYIVEFRDLLMKVVYDHKRDKLVTIMKY